ncbi:ABC transporter substrate-binding protein [Ruania rhizosphaerae]|uniref:ABC transporter substrate-binding protein n=1 Tax=Ruania rhizosphaerae TaxID=1840413 RepID=UPI001356D80A|nr:sugar ABC transporter substrate-binding protein [Ruania rhizosphaerae]
MVHRRSVSALASLVLAGTLAACGSGTSDTSEDATPDGPVDLRMTVWTADEGHLGLFQEIADAYVADHPDEVSSVTFETIPFEDYTTTLTTQLAGGNTPDLAWVFESNAPEFVSSGALAEIGGTLEATDGYEYEDLLGSALDLWSNDDGLYAYPFSNSPFVMFVNTDRIAEAGQTQPSELHAGGEWTYDSARDISAATVEDLGGAGLVVRDFDYTAWSNLASVWGAWGAQPWSADGTTCEFDSPEMVDALSWFHDAVYTQGAIPGPGTAADFFSGDTTMTITQISRASALDGSFEWDIVPLPTGPAGQPGVIGQAGIGVLANGENPGAAANFLAHFTNPENASQLSQYFPPPRTSLLTTESLAEGNPAFDERQLEIVVEAIDGAATKPSHVNYAQVDTATRSALDALWTETGDAAAVATEVCAAIDPLLQD